MKLFTAEVYPTLILFTMQLFWPVRIVASTAACLFSAVITNFAALTCRAAEVEAVGYLCHTRRYVLDKYIACAIVRFKPHPSLFLAITPLV